MPEGGSRAVERDRRRLAIIRHLEDFPRQYAALENAMGAFGDDFDLQVFKAAFNTLDDLDAYNRAQALERAVGRVQNYTAELAVAGSRLAELARPSVDGHSSQAQQAFEALRDGEIISPSVCRRLVAAQNARARIEHGYLQIPAGDVHRAATLVRDAARDFIGAYRDWIGRYLQEQEA